VANARVGARRTSAARQVDLRRAWQAPQPAPQDFVIGLITEQSSPNDDSLDDCLRSVYNRVFVVFRSCGLTLRQLHDHADEVEKLPPASYIKVVTR